MRKTAAAITLASALLIMAAAGSQLVNLGMANPYHHIWVEQGTVSPDSNTKPPEISILSPERGALLAATDISIAINVKVGESSTAVWRFLDEIYYEADWLPNQTSVYDYDLEPAVNQMEPQRLTEFSEAISLRGVPDGNHSITIYAVEKGRYQTGQGPIGSGLNTISYTYYYVNFHITGVKHLRFMVDTAPPVVSILELENRTFVESEVSLNFTLSEPASAISYVLDGQESVEVKGNITLPALSEGLHNVTVYAWDAAGNIGSSKTVTFSVAVPEPFPTVPVAAASVVAVVVACGGLLVYFGKHKRQTLTASSANLRVEEDPIDPL